MPPTSYVFPDDFVRRVTAELPDDDYLRQRLELGHRREVSQYLYSLSHSGIVGTGPFTAEDVARCAGPDGRPLMAEFNQLQQRATRILRLKALYQEACNLRP